MLRKMILVAVVAGLAVAAFRGTRWGSYVRSELRCIKEAAEDQIPPEKEIARLRGEVRMLDDDTIKLVKQLARLQSDQDDLTRRQKELENRKGTVSEVIRNREAAVRAAEAKVKAGEVDVSVSFGSQKFSLEVGKARLKEAVRDYTDFDKELGRIQAKKDSQQRIIDKLEKQRLGMTRLKADLDGAIDELEEELQAIKLQQMESKYQVGGGIDDSRVAHIKEAIAKQKKKFDVQRRELTMLQGPETQPTGPTESVDEIMAPLKAKTAPDAAPNGQLPKAD